MTRISTIPSRVYRDHYSPIRFSSPPPRVYQRDVVSPVRIFSSPSRIVNVRVKPSALSREFDRIDRKYRFSPVGPSFTDDYLNSTYATVRVKQTHLCI